MAEPLFIKEKIMGFKRAAWRSGLTYQNTCPQCRTVVRYMDDILDFRPWFPDGFVYCPTCKKPLRHNENLAIDPATGKPLYAQVQQAQSTSTHGFCTKCGNQFTSSDPYCGNCGAKR